MINNTKEDYIKKTECICCKSKNLIKILDLDKQPLANNYLECYDSEVIEYPLSLNLCTNCYHMQLSHIVNPDLMFKYYTYITGISETFKDYCINFKDYTIRQFNLYNKTSNYQTVLDIACNDGTLLDIYSEHSDCQTFGIDPSINIYNEITKNKKHNIICNYFNNESVKELKEKYQINSIDIITAQNVFAHLEDVDDFLKNCKKLMKLNSLLFIQTSQSDMIVNNEFDTIYHEHVSFFNISSMNALLKRHNLVLLDIKKVPIHGNSYIFTISKNLIYNNSILVKFEYLMEKQIGLYDSERYIKYETNVHKFIELFYQMLENLKTDGYKIIGYGAPAKATTLLNSVCKLLNKNIEIENMFDYIIDDTPYKQNKYLANPKIKIISNEYLNSLNQNEKIAFIPLAWNFYTEIVNKIKKQLKQNNVNPEVDNYLFIDIKLFKLFVNMQTEFNLTKYSANNKYIEILKEINTIEL